jgi:large subunit ribosomal protein L25
MAKAGKTYGGTADGYRALSGAKTEGAGMVPAVIYGAKDKAETLQVSVRDINAMLSHASGENILVELEVAGKNRLALVQEVQHAPLGDAILHVDFHAVSVDEKIQATCRSRPLGLANGVKNMGGLLEQNLRVVGNRMFAA